MAIAIGNLEDMLFFPYNSEGEVGFEDRLYNSQDWADYFKQFIGNGVFPNPSNGLKVESLHNSMVLTVRMGAGFANGRLYMQKKDFEFSVIPAHLTLGRRDIVICRHDAINRTMQILYIEGTASSVPITPPIVRTDDIYDLKLCEITINPNAQAITQANILDTRLNSEVCGIVHGLIDQVDTTDIFNQYQDFLNREIVTWENIRETQESNWTKQLQRQESDWKTQTEQQQSDFDQFKAVIDSWRDLTIAELAQQVSFNFDNQLAFPGTLRTMEITGKVVTSQMTIKSSGNLFAERILTNNMPANVTTDLKLYDAQTKAQVYHRRAVMTLVNGMPRTEVIEL